MIESAYFLSCPSMLIEPQKIHAVIAEPFQTENSMVYPNWQVK
jgi:hypothetical protein